jgi:hypothetical protein
MFLDMNGWIFSEMNNFVEQTDIVDVKIVSYPHYSKMNTLSLLKTAI